MTRVPPMPNWISTLTALAITSDAFLSVVLASTIPFYMVVKLPVYLSIPPYTPLWHDTQIPSFIVVPKLGKAYPAGTQNKYFFLKPLHSIDAQTLEQSKFWYDTSNRKVYSETTTSNAPGSGGMDISIGLTTSIEEDFLQNSGAEILDLSSSLGAGIIPPQANLNAENLQMINAIVSAKSGAELPSAMIDLTTNMVTQRWEVFGDGDVPTGEMAGLLTAANLEADGEEMQDIYGGNIALEWKMFQGMAAAEVINQLWLWRCNLPLSVDMRSRFPDMDAAAAAEYFKGLDYLLLVRTKFEDEENQTPENHQSWDFDDMKCFRIQPWARVLAVPLREVDNNLEEIQQGIYHPELAGRSLQILDGGDLFEEKSEL
ncbi:hypothetical protein TWF694_007790 [Orbilia ellipsospora]|uniref:Uncharacterized protein n=1 Tax=Orbilia ellipsospora TaxID=2528407 RepID=A0AAV9XIR5_9PEZI